MLICRNAEGVQGQRKVGNPWFKQCYQPTKFSNSSQNLTQLSQLPFLPETQFSTVLSKLYLSTRSL